MSRQWPATTGRASIAGDPCEARVTGRASIAGDPCEARVTGQASIAGDPRTLLADPRNLPHSAEITVG
ncbi:MAG: hypothetical protein KDB14_24480, partial [Planctomycetales bacterium]|nr:hypothetical protein [Planctomycetales bacterium]